MSDEINSAGYRTQQIDKLKAIQRRLNLGGVHLVWLGEHGFAIAHTDEERATIDLHDCELHKRLGRAAPEGTGYYIVTPNPDGGYGFDFTPLVGIAAGER